MSNAGLTAEERAYKDLRLTNYALLPFLLMGAVIITIRYGVEGTAPWAIASMWAASCLISGAVFGFLFCIPRVVEPKKTNGVSGGGEAEVRDSSRNDASANSSATLQVNSNLVEISDWLTKIIVGLGLINLKEIPEHLASAADVLAAGLAGSTRCQGGSENCEHYAFATSLIVAFCVLGFFMGYLYTRLFLAGAFQRADNVGSSISKAVNSAIKTGDAPLERSTSAAQVAVSERVKTLVAKVDSDSVVDQLQRYARNYDELRLENGGPERTRKMTRVLVEMRTLALAGYEELPKFAGGTHAGERLVAIAMLQVRPMKARIRWLIERLTTETPFISYAAADALRRAMAEFSDPADKSLLRNELIEFVRSPAGHQFVHADHDRAAILGEVLRQLDISIGPKESAEQ